MAQEYIIDLVDWDDFVARWQASSDPELAAESATRLRAFERDPYYSASLQFRDLCLGALSHCDAAWAAPLARFVRGFCGSCGSYIDDLGDPAARGGGEYPYFCQLVAPASAAAICADLRAVELDAFAAAIDAPSDREFALWQLCEWRDVFARAADAELGVLVRIG